MRKLLFCFLCLLLAKSSYSQQIAAHPEKLGFSPPTLTNADAILQRYVDQKKLAGVVALVARKGEIFYLRSFGMQDIENDRKMQENSLFQIASMTKPITTIALLMLWEEGKVKLDDPITKYIPSFSKLKVALEDGSSIRPKTPLTLKHFLQHTTGLPALGDPSINERIDRSKINSLKEYVDSFANLPLKHQPEEKFTYSLNTDVIGRVVEIVSGQPFEVFIKERIFDPLGMKDTFYNIPEDKVNRFSSIYTSTESGFQLRQGPTTTPEKFVRANGGLTSTAYDYFLFSQMMLNKGELGGKRLVKKGTIELMTSNLLPAHLYPLTVMGTLLEDTGFGYGVAVLTGDPKNWKPKPLNFPNSWNLPAGSYYWSGSVNTYWWADPANEIVGVFMSQLTNLGEFPVFQEFHQSLYNHLYSRKDDLILEGAFPVNATITPEERDFLYQHMTDSKNGLMKAVKGLSKKEQNFKFDPNRWSVLECMEHITITESSLWEWAHSGLATPPDPARKSEVKVNEKMIIARLNNRDNKLSAPDEARPVGKYKSVKEAINDYSPRRDETLAFVKSTQDDLRNHFVVHPVAGTIDVYMALVLLSAHQNRHLMQIREIMEHPDFPKK